MRYASDGYVIDLILKRVSQSDPMSTRASDDPFFDPRNDWTHPSQSIAANMRRRSAASSRADQAKMLAEQRSVKNLREIFVTKQKDYDSLEARAAGYQERIAALEAQLAKLSSDLQSVTEDVALAGDDLLGADGVREGRVDAAADQWWRRRRRCRGR